MMRVTILGSGTSMGVPTLTCKCPVCLSTDPRDQRLRSGLWIQANGQSLLIDVSIDFRQQALANDIQDVDAVLLTHTHSDHISGLDDLRVYNLFHKKKIRMYAQPTDLDDLRRRFDYCFNPIRIGGGVPDLELHPIHGPFQTCGLAIVPVPIKHGVLDILGYRIGQLGVLTDASYISEASLQLLAGVDVLIINALRPKPHATHFSLAQALAVSQRIGPRQTYFVHMSHHLGHGQTNRELPPGAELAYDGLTFEVSDGALGAHHPRE